MKILNGDGIKALDLTPLQDLKKLESLRCEFDPERDVPILKKIKTLKTLNGKPKDEFLEPVKSP